MSMSVSFPRFIQPGHVHEDDNDDDNNDDGDDNNNVPPDSMQQHQPDFLRVTQSPEIKVDKKLRYVNMQNIL